MVKACDTWAGLTARVVGAPLFYVIAMKSSVVATESFEFDGDEINYFTVICCNLTKGPFSNTQPIIFVGLYFPAT